MEHSKQTLRLLGTQFCRDSIRKKNFIYHTTKIFISGHWHNLLTQKIFPMLRYKYDTDVTVWSPQGRLLQVEYAMEAVRIGNIIAGIKSKDYAVIVALHRAQALQLSFSLRKILHIDDYMGMAFTGLTSDARDLTSYMRSQCQSYKYAYNSTYPILKLVTDLGNKMQINTQRFNKRPYGVGLLVAGYDEMGPHIFQVMPSADFYNCKAMSIGARSQCARSYLKHELANFDNCTREELILYALKAVNNSLSPNEMENDKSLLISLGVVGKHEPFHVLTDNEVIHYQEIVKASDFYPSYPNNPETSTSTKADDNDVEMSNEIVEDRH